MPPRKAAEISPSFARRASAGEITTRRDVIALDVLRAEEAPPLVVRHHVRVDVVCVALDRLPDEESGVRLEHAECPMMVIRTSSSRRAARF